MYLIYQKPVFFFRNPLKNLVYFLLCHLGMQDCDPVKPEFQTDHFIRSSIAAWSCSIFSNISNWRKKSNVIVGDIWHRYPHFVNSALSVLVLETSQIITESIAVFSIFLCLVKCPVCIFKELLICISGNIFRKKADPHTAGCQIRGSRKFKFLATSRSSVFLSFFHLNRAAWLISFKKDHKFNRHPDAWSHH